MTILITGGSGLLGGNIAAMAIRKSWNVVATYNKNPVRMEGVRFIQIDLTKKEQLKRIARIGPDVIVHCAALTNVDYCEDHFDEAYSHNTLVSASVAEVADEVGAYLVHISTDSVFDGVKGSYKEDDTPRPVNVYGKTKLEAERQVLSLCPHSCVVRTNIYGWNKRAKLSLAEWMLNKLQDKEELSGFKDVIASPILVNDLIRYLFKLYALRYEGIIHIAGSEPCTKLDFAYMVAEVFAQDKGLIRSTSIDEMELKAPRGKDLSLNVSKAETIFKETLPNVQEGLTRMRELRDSGYVAELKR